MRMIFLLLALVLASTTQAGKIYRWVDENGQVHYGTSIPPEYQKQARDELNEQGVVTEHVERAATPEELAARQAAEEARRQAEEAERKRQIEAQQILVNYNSEEDIQRRRKLRLEGVERSLQITRDTLAAQQRNLDQLNKQAAEQERSGRTVSKALLSAIRDMKAQMAKQREYLQTKEKEKAKIDAEFDHILQEYRRIKQQYGQQKD